MVISVSRFSAPLCISGQGRRIVLKKRKIGRGKLPPAIGVDDKTVATASKVYSIHEAPALIANCCVLTSREASILIKKNPLLSPPMVLEEMFPWIGDFLFYNNSVRSREVCLGILRRYGKHLVPNATYASLRWNAFCNKVGMKSTLDSVFYFAWHTPIQGAYRFRESSPRRSIVAIDFNSMFGSCMQQLFPAPSKLENIEVSSAYFKGMSLPLGLYRCILRGKMSAMLGALSPFRIYLNGRHISFTSDTEIEVQLNEFEIDFFARHFEEVFVCEGVGSKETVTHPLARQAKQLYAERMCYRRQGNTAMERLTKQKLTLLTSCTQRPGQVSRRFSKLCDALSFIEKEYRIFQLPGEPLSAFLSNLTKNRSVTLQMLADGVEVTGPDVSGRSCCNLFSQRIVALSRIKVLELVENIMKSLKNVEICYCNIDSIHFSYSREDREDVLNWLEMKSSERMGGFKIEALAESGLWLEPGRYWLYGDGKVVKFGNIGISRADGAFGEVRLFRALRQVRDLHIPITGRVHMSRLLSDSSGIVRNSLGEEIHAPVKLNSSFDFWDVIRQLAKNRITAIPEKIAAFQKLKSHFEL